MQGKTAHRAAGVASRGGRPPAAVVWIGPDHALVARRGADGAIAVHDVARASTDPEELGRYLTAVVDEIGDAGRVVVMGPDDLRVDLEREFVTIGHRPDRIVDISPNGPVDRDALLARLATIAA